MRQLCFALLLSTVAAISDALSQAIDFEDRAAGTTIRAEYGSRGVIFPNAFLDADPHARSGTRVLRAVSPNAEVFTPVPLVMTFPNRVRHVAFFAGNYPGVTGRGTLKAFGANNALLAQDGPKPVSSNAFSTFFEVRDPARRIVRAEFQIEGSALASVDDLVLEGNVGPLPTTPPAVAITNPSEGSVLAEGAISMSGTVTGAALLDPITLRVQFGLPPGSTAPPSQNDVTLSGSGSTRTFSLDYDAIVGPYTVSAIAKNAANLEGTATVHFAVLPAAIKARYDTSGGAAQFGALRFGTRDGDCVMAVYETGLIAATGNQTFVVKRPIFAKWLATREPGTVVSKLGCPTAEARDALAGARAQDFSRGRIYATATAAAYVPAVFRDAIDSLGGDASVGLPTSDPTSDSHPAYVTWLFQRFEREGIPVASTLEIRGDPPRLFVERQGGDLSLFTGVVRVSNPVIVQSFDCASTAGPCPVVPPPEEPLFTGATALCHGKEFDWKQQVDGLATFTPDPPEWVPIRGDFIPVPIWGVLFKVELAKGDNPFTHRNRFEPCPRPVLEAVVNELICPSDWDLRIRPLPGFRSMQPVNRDAVQIEFERVDFQHQLVAYGDPSPGDLIFAAGRFVVDCGHGGGNLDAFKTEIHPPSVYTAVKMVTRNGRPATQADIWVNWFFSGGDAPGEAVEFDIVPPPRPSPQALLGASTPGDQNAAVKVTFKSLGPFGPMRVRVTATRRTPEVTKYGEMKPRKETVPFGFDGRLHVFWNCPAGATCR